MLTVLAVIALAWVWFGLRREMRARLTNVAKDIEALKARVAFLERGGPEAPRYDRPLEAESKPKA
ncbi:MAG: hypothetical protein ACRD1Q_06205, partial [Vicinamibacterales bacterium]